MTDDPEDRAPDSGQSGWFGRLRAGLSRTRVSLREGLGGLFSRGRIDEATLESLEEQLIAADLGPKAAHTLTEALRTRSVAADATTDSVAAILAETIAGILEPVARPLALDPEAHPHVILVVGVNGVGKTTTIGKLAHDLGRPAPDGTRRRVMVAAGDTFRAAAVGQLQIWGERTGCTVVARGAGADAAGLAFDALAQAKAEGADLLLIDTAGRLQNKTDLMAELQKVVRVLKKQDPALPHATLLVLDATTGQNAHSQVEVFRDMVQVTGLVLTKLDGSARGGVLVALAEKFGLPVHAIGVGEGIDDLRPFDAQHFARSLMGLEP